MKRRNFVKGILGLTCLAASGASVAIDKAPAIAPASIITMPKIIDVNKFDSNHTKKLAQIFLKKFEETRVLTKNTDTVYFKRPTSYGGN